MNEHTMLQIFNFKFKHVIRHFYRYNTTDSAESGLPRALVKITFIFFIQLSP